MEFTYAQESRRYPAGACLRKYHATRLLRQQDQPEPQLQDEAPSAATAGINTNAIIDTARIDETRPVITTQGEATTEQDVTSTEGEELPTKISDPDVVDPELKEAVRSVLRKVPNSVAVITVKSIDPETKQHVPMGVAVSSLSSVTLDPPTISFNIKQPSKTLDAIRAADGLFRVHFPTASSAGANVVELFCRGNQPDAYILRSRDLELFVPSDSSQEGATTSLAPQIRDKTICASMECTVTHEVPIADHVILAARVDSLERTRWKDATIAYADGKYMRSDSVIALHGSSSNPSNPANSGNNWSIWDYPLFHGEEVRKDYLEYIKTVINSDQEYLDKPLHQATRKLENALPYSPVNFGIDTSVLLAKCREDKAPNDEPQNGKETSPVLAEFYGRLSPHAMATVLERAKKLVKEDPLFLSFNYKEFLTQIGVNNRARNILPSDFMSALRAEGLVGEFEPSKGFHGRSYSIHYDLETLEQVEVKLREHLRTLEYEEALHTRLDTIVTSFGLDRSAASYLNKSRPRLIAESQPEQFDDSKINIRGEVTQEEARIVLRRIMRFLEVKNPHNLAKQLRIPPYEALRIKGVHPTITGMDVEYIFGKINHLHGSISRPDDFDKAITEMLAPYFEGKIEWDDLEQRAKNLVQKHPSQAISKSLTDKLAAVGLSWNAKVIKTGDKKLRRLLRGSNIFEEMLARELINHLGKGTDEENRAIAQYLEEIDGARAHSKQHLTFTPSQLPADPSSSDEMQKAMLATPYGDGSNGTRINWKTSGIRGKRTADGNLIRTHFAAAPSFTKYFVKKSAANKNSGTGWSTYSLNGEKK
ncbi:hypothetical protein N0V83_008437 [Neocucurbitaria cava]|uniref:Flavin reductase like domain-containing protein n=1 Tax=Neocucurbitaria cava TaxID=798079 RepID=A0A9W8Y242_9PLEO|nr:hypothetical protein N0V83_008437 [Neocucurbitaria cava]